MFLILFTLTDLNYAILDKGDAETEKPEVLSNQPMIREQKNKNFYYIKSEHKKKGKNKNKGDGAGDFIIQQRLFSGKALHMEKINFQGSPQKVALKKHTAYNHDGFQSICQ